MDEYKVVINSGVSIMLSTPDNRVGYMFKSSSQSSCPSFPPEFTACPDGYTCTGNPQNTNSVQGFDLNHMNIATNGSLSTCAVSCNSNTNCAGFALDTNTNACKFKSVTVGNYADGSDTYTFASKNNPMFFVLFNKQNNGFFTIDDQIYNYNYDGFCCPWFSDWTTNEIDNGRFVNWRASTTNSSPIPSKSIWRYDSINKTIVSLASNAYVYISQQQDKRLKIGYGAPDRSTNADILICQFYYDTSDSTSHSYKNLVSIDDGGTKKYISCTTGNMVIGATNPTNNSIWELLFLPAPIPLRRLPTQLDTFFLLRTSTPIFNGNYGYVCAQSESDGIPKRDGNIIIKEDDGTWDPYKTSCTMWSAVGISSANNVLGQNNKYAICIRYWPGKFINILDGNHQNNLTLYECNPNEAGIQTNCYGTGFDFTDDDLKLYFPQGNRGTATISEGFNLSYDPSTNYIYTLQKSGTTSLDLNILMISSDSASLTTYTSMQYEN
jgi:hypothetical protein